MKIVCGTYFTKNWCYSIESWAVSVKEAIRRHRAIVILACDNSEDCLEHTKKASKILGGFDVETIVLDSIDDNQKAYKNEAQRIIARLQSAVFFKARELEADYFWSVESDVIVPPNALSVLLQALEFDDCYYSIGMVTYPNGQFLGGRGTQKHPIAEDFLPEERDIPKELKKRLEKREEEVKELLEKGEQPSKEQREKWEEIDKKIKECKPIGNVFELQAKGWKRRGWLESAYPAVGRGAILPTDWVGLGCTLLNKKALSMATFDGYDLGGTQDLFLCWNRWHQHELKMCVIPHILCSHIKRKIDKDGNRTDEIEVHEAYHELDGDFVGHLRWRPKKYYNFNS